MSVRKLICEAFVQARLANSETYSAWTKISHKIGGLLPNSTLVVSVQNLGQMDVVLRAMEDEPQPSLELDELLGTTWLRILSDLWVGSAYEVIRTLVTKERGLGLVPLQGGIAALEHDLKLLRVPLEKHEIAGRKKALPEQLDMQRLPPIGDPTDHYVYRRDDPHRAHIMRFDISERGSIIWEALDLTANEPKWLERRSLSERFLSLATALPSGGVHPTSPSG